MSNRKSPFASIPHVADDYLDPFEYRLYGHYERVWGETGKPCEESTRQTAKATKMSAAKVSRTRSKLADNGWIALENGKREAVIVSAGKSWQLNDQKYKDRSPQKQTVSHSNTAFPTATDRSPQKQTVSHSNTHNNVVKEVKKEEVEENIFVVWDRDGGMKKMTQIDVDGLADMERTFGLPICTEAIQIATRTVGRGKLVVNYVWSICKRIQDERKPVVVPNLGTMRRHASPS